MFDQRVVVRGSGDLGSGVALRLWRSGFPVFILETPSPLAVRRTVAFSEAVYAQRAWVEEAEARLAASPAEALALSSAGVLPVLVDPEVRSFADLAPYALIDAIVAKRNTGTRMDMAPFTVALGPGFVAGQDVHAVIETNRGPSLGRVIWSGMAEPNTGEPGEIAGKRAGRVLRAPASGILTTRASIGDVVEEGAVIATVDGSAVVAGFTGLVRGLLRDGTAVTCSMKIGDIDPRLDPKLVELASDKALAIAGGVLEAILASMMVRNRIDE